jgi:hypothetical protein
LFGIPKQQELPSPRSAKFYADVYLALHSLLASVPKNLVEFSESDFANSSLIRVGAKNSHAQKLPYDGVGILGPAAPANRNHAV